MEVSLIKERLRSLKMSEKIMFHLMEVLSNHQMVIRPCLIPFHSVFPLMQSMAEYADDEMVSLVEFRRLFKAYTAKKS